MGASCSLSADGRVRQLERYARLSAAVVSVEREPRVLSVSLADGFDRALLDETLAIERECCPWLDIAVDGSRFSIGVESDEHAPMLDVFAEALAPAATAR